jgi:AraC-like DNA-binding protein/mannose-6-phosphate isomerase-like protein (cupin superfamily)
MFARQRAPANRKLFQCFCGQTITTARRGRTEWRPMIPALSPESLASLDLQVLTVQRTEVGRWWNFRNVISPFSRLWLILEGRATVSHHGRSFVLKPGQLHLVPPFTVHNCACARRMDHYHLHFVSRLPTGIDLFSLLDGEMQIPAGQGTLEFFRRLETIYPDRKLPCFDPAREEYRRLPALLEPAGQGGDAVDWLEAKGILTLLLAPFLRTAHPHEGTHARASRLFLSVQEYIHQHMREAITLGDLAKVANLHPTYFSDRFRQLVGVRPLEYLMRRRIERAQYLLLASPASVKQVADEVGIADAGYFTRAFTRHCGKSPSAYRVAHFQ